MRAKSKHGHLSKPSTALCRAMDCGLGPLRGAEVRGAPPQPHLPPPTPAQSETGMELDSLDKES